MFGNDIREKKGTKTMDTADRLDQRRTSYGEPGCRRDGSEQDRDQKETQYQNAVVPFVTMQWWQNAWI
jgi:hypothetical protein